MKNLIRSTWVEIDLSALEKNIQNIRGLLAPEVSMMAVVKADGYGCGAVKVAQVALENGADRLAVAVLSEGMELRAAGITVPILILGYTQNADLVVEHDLIQTVYDFASAQRLAEAAKKQGKTAKIHVKLETGMGRLGIKPEKAVALIQQIQGLDHLEIEGMFTHFALADIADKTYTKKQYARFMAVKHALEQSGILLSDYHVCNSAATMELPEMHLNMVRPGVILYGMYPSEEVDKKRLCLHPILSWKAEVVHVKEIEAGESVSYGCRYRAAEKRIIATLPVGYGDGFTRLYFGKGEVLIRGQRAPIVGTICMDQCMVDVTAIPDVQTGDEVVIIGSQGEEAIYIEELAQKIGTINYEISCMIRNRVPRVYVRRDG